MPQAALALRAAFLVQKSSHRGGIFSSQKQLQRRNFRFKKATIEVAFLVRKATLEAEFSVQKKQPQRLLPTKKDYSRCFICYLQKKDYFRYFIIYLKKRYFR